ncbi:hypothetical protein AOLI_G00091450 [Acnodon oligacanthus]
MSSITTNIICIFSLWPPVQTHPTQQAEPKPQDLRKPSRCTWVKVSAQMPQVRKQQLIRMDYITCRPTGHCLTPSYAPSACQT